jgi:ABC-2 type transport system permease protein
MLWYKAWRESSVRFLLGGVVIGCMCLIYVFFAGRLYPGVVREHPAVHNYTQYIHWSVFGGATRGMLQLTCLLLGLGGMQRDRKQDSLGFTLALPVSRISLVLSRATLGAVQILALSLLPPFLIAGASALVHQPFSLWYGLHFVPLWAIGGVFTFAMSFLFSALLSNEYVSLVSAYMAYMFYLAATRHPRLSAYHMHVADFMSGFHPGYLNRTTMLWNAHYPVLPLFGFLAAGMLFVAVATFVTTRQDL